MRSTLRERDGALAEKLGPVEMTFRLNSRDSGIDWFLIRVTACGVALPRRWFTISAHSGARADRYTFTVDVALLWVGKIIRYEGELDVVSSA